MADIYTLINLQTTIFLLVLAGYVMTKLGILPASVRRPLTDLVLDFILPCNIVVSFLTDFDETVMKGCLTALTVSIGIQLFSFVAGEYFYPRAEKRQHTVLKYATIVSNAGFLGNPIAQGIFGDMGLLYASIYLIPVRIFMWSAGITCFTGAKGKNVVKRVITNPCIIAVAVGLVLMIFQIHLPAGIEKTLRTAGSCNTALSMLVIGNILAEVRIRDVCSKKAFWYCAVRLLILPLLVLAVCRIFSVDSTVAGVSAVLAGMPAPASVVMLASRYDGDEHFAVKLIFLSTVLSLVTIPAICMFL